MGDGMIRLSSEIVGNRRKIGDPNGRRRLPSLNAAERLTKARFRRTSWVEIVGGKETPVAHHIIKIRRRWYAVLDIPKALRKHFGKARFKVSLDTESESVALRRVGLHISRWKGEIEAARVGTSDPLEADIRYWRKMHSEEEQRGNEAGVDAIEDAVMAIAESMEKVEPGSGVVFYKRAVGEVIATSEHLDDWLRTLSDEPKTIDLKRSTVERFALEFPTLPDVTRKKVQEWARRRVLDEGRKPATIRRALSELRGYWQYLTSIEVVTEDSLPFEKIDVPKVGKKEAVKLKRRAFTATEVVGLLRAAEDKGDHQLADLIRLGMWTGARIEELCSLKVNNVQETHFEVEDAKTEAGWRKVPIHSRLKPTIDRLIKDSTDGFVLSGLSDKGKYGDRSTAIGKRFGRLKTAQGFGSQHVFHSIRHTVATLLENAGVLQNITSDILGHEKEGMSYGQYSAGGEVPIKSENLEKISYPEG